MHPYDDLFIYYVLYFRDDNIVNCKQLLGVFFLMIFFAYLTSFISVTRQTLFGLKDINRTKRFQYFLDIRSKKKITDQGAACACDSVYYLPWPYL